MEQEQEFEITNEGPETSDVSSAFSTAASIVYLVY